VDLIPDEKPLKPRLRAIQDLTDYATSYRYPRPKGRIKTPPSKKVFERDAVPSSLHLKMPHATLEST